VRLTPTGTDCNRDGGGPFLTPLPGMCSKIICSRCSEHRVVLEKPPIDHEIREDQKYDVAANRALVRGGGDEVE